MSKANGKIRTASAALLAGTILASQPALAQQSVPQPSVEPTSALSSGSEQPVRQVVKSLRIVGNQRLEGDTIRTYAGLFPGQEYDQSTLDAALKALYETRLFADAEIGGADTGNLVIQVKENPVINRIILEGNKKIKDDKINPEIKLSPREIFTRDKVRADVDRIIELYKRQGRFAATVDPQIVQLDQNRVDVVFKINEGAKSKIRAINIVGNQQFDDGKLIKQMYTKEAGGLLGLFKSNDSYDPDRLAADQSKLRSFYLTQGYADFRVVSALAELTPDRRDFVITYVVEEGPRYKFGEIKTESALRDLQGKNLDALVTIEKGQWFDASKVEAVIDSINQAAGFKGYAFSEVAPQYDRNADKREIALTFRVKESPRVYVDKIAITGNSVTRDNVIRREFRVDEGDAFNAVKIKRTQDRLQNLGFFQDKLEIKQQPADSPDRVNLAVDVEEKSTGTVSVSAGYSSYEKLIFSGQISESNFRGMGQIASAGVDWSRYSKSAQLSFTDPYAFGKPLVLGGSLFRRDFNSFSYNLSGGRQTTYGLGTTGFQLNSGFPLNEYASIGANYSLSRDNLTLSQETFFTDPDGTGPLAAVCDPAKAGTYLCDELGKRITSLLGVSFGYNNTDGIRATKGQRISLSQEFAGLGGDTRYLRTRANATKYFGLGSDFVFSLHGEGGTIVPLEKSTAPFKDRVRITDRFFTPQMRGFDIRGTGPRVQNYTFVFDDAGNQVVTATRLSDALGGHNYYLGRAELEFPVNAALRNFGIRPSAYVDAGAVWGLRTPQLTTINPRCVPTAAAPTGSVAQDVLVGSNCNALNASAPAATPYYTYSVGQGSNYVGDSARPRVAIGVGINWTSPFGPLRLDLAKAIVKEEGDDTKLFSINVGTQF